MPPVMMGCGGALPQRHNQGGGGGAPAFSPADLAPWLWYDTQLYQDTGGATPVTATTQAVALQKNRGSSGSSDANQATSGMRPTATSLAPAEVTYDGADDWLRIGTGTTPVVAGAQWLCLRYRLTSAAAADRCALALWSGSLCCLLYINTSSGAPLIAVLGQATGTTGVQATPGGGVDTAWHTLLIEMTGGVQTITYDGVALTTSAGPAASTPSVSTIGIFNGSSFPAPLSSRLVLYGAGTLTAGQKSSLLTYAGSL